jgi:hypothetical protein
MARGHAVEIGGSAPILLKKSALGSAEGGAGWLG